MPAVEHRPPDRRKFLRAAAATGAALTLPAKSYTAIAGTAERIRVGFLGCGGRAQAHIHLVTKSMPDLGTTAVAVCDVWDGLDEDYEQTFGGNTVRRRYSQGLFPSAVRCGLDVADKSRVTKDYRRVLDRKDVDVVCVATPDHWHGRMVLDAVAAGKDVLVETPMTRTPAEATAVVDAAARQNRVVAVAEQALADPVWRTARDLLRAGRIGPLVQASAGAYRNDIRGQWRFYRLVSQMTPTSIDWDLFLGHRFDVFGEKLGPTPQDQPFDRAKFAQWRCYSPFSGGPFTDFFVHPVARLLTACGLGFPGRVTGAGGLFRERDGRDVPDVATLVADFDEGCQLLVTGSTLSAYPIEEVIRGRTGALKFVRGGIELIRDERAGGAGLPARLERTLTPGEVVPVAGPTNETEELWRNFLDCVRRRDRATWCPPEAGAAAVATVALAHASCRDGRAYGWDRERRQVVPADGWTASGAAVALQPPAHMALAGPWTDHLA